MVVIAIIAILVAVGLVTYSTAQRKGRDARRRSDIKAMQNGFEQYYANNDQYSTALNCDAMLDTAYFPSGEPADPDSTKSYSCGSYGTNGYCICAELDDTTDGNATDGNCSNIGSTSGTHYCLTNLQ